MGYTCEYHPEGQASADLLLTSLRSGQTLASCTNDAPVMLAGALASHLGIDVGPLWSAIERHVKRQHRAEPAHEPESAVVLPPPGKVTCPYCEQVLDVGEGGLGAVAEAHLPSCPGPSGGTQGGDKS